ncbi:MAG: DUF2608 domain-containing protein [Parachlamydia sp.]|nr:DUF2608 domain-containing protein [Parachlamydia sp.]
MMKKLLSFLFLIVLPLQGLIVETKEMSTVLQHVDSHSLILFNVTDTLYEPSITLADNQWRMYFSRLAEATVPNSESFVNRYKNMIVNNIPKKLIEPFTIQLIRELQKEHQPVLGITQKHPSAPYAEDYGEITNRHLKNMGIDLERTLDFLPMKNKMEYDPHSFAYGIIFTDKQPEGPAILSFLQRLKWNPKKVILVDDSHAALSNVEASLKPTGIKFIGVRYGRCDGRKYAFDADLGTIQFFEFIKKGRAISDEEARKFKQEHPDMHFESLLIDFIHSNTGQ